MLISVAVPTHNRPQLLREALASVAAQTHPQWEVVVVDDDDLLAPTALAQIAAAYARHPELECMFVNIESFGTCAPGTTTNQSHALSRLLERAQRVQDNGVVFFNNRLLSALLKSVPMAIQRPAVRKTLWDKVGLLRKGSCYMPEPEWAMKVAQVCKPALLLQYAYLARMDGQNYVTRTAQKEKHMLAAVDIRTTLLAWIAGNPAFAARAREVKHSLADVYFDQAYHRQRSGNCRAAWRPLFASFVTHPQWRSVRFALRLLLPCIKRRKTD